MTIQHARYTKTLAIFVIALAVVLNLLSFRTSTAEEPEKVSSFEDYVRQRGPVIHQFGYDLFRESPSTFAPVDTVSVGPGYILGPGDELRISLWGKLNADYVVRIDREGKIIIPQVGALNISGLTFSDAKASLEKEFSRYYIASEVKMNISMGALRTTRVFVVGKARRPGSYTLSSLSTLVNALFAAGGPSKSGTMRDIQVKRDGKTIVSFDLYDLLIKGDKTKDMRLMPEDVIFIPPAGPLVGISGDVRTPAIYELKGDLDIAGLIELAGGLNDIAFKGRFQIERIENGKGGVSEANLEDPMMRKMQVQQGDIVQLYTVSQDRRFVKLMGAVQSPGEYGIGKGLKISDLVNLAGGLKYFAMKDEAELTRVTATPEGPKTEKIIIKLKRALEKDPSADLALKEDDFLFIKSVPEWEKFKTLDVVGEVRHPGTYTIKKGERLSSLIERAGGFTERAYLKGAVFERDSVKVLQQRQLNESIDRLEFQLISESAQSIEGSLSAEEVALQRAGVEQRKALIAKMRAAKAKGRISIRIEEPSTLKGSPSDILLEQGDVLYIPERPSQVQVIGAVYNQTAFIHAPKLSLSNYIQKAGGMSKDADRSEIYILKVDGTAVSAHEKGFFNFGWDSDENRWESGGFMSLRLDPGDTIVIPEKIEKVNWLREVKDITQILYQIAVTAGVLIVAF
ncbi:MAG: SLBB domain-containing protein [Deltaproteobacteria bacterium]|nr:SLBB domain-containing protein [Deltaproteobacteria bacterium]